MSRSRKKLSIYTDYSRGKSGTSLSKRFASKSIRNSEDDISNGNNYKKLYNSYNIRDWKSIITNTKSKEYKKGKKK